MLLSEIADIYSGYLFRTKVENVEKGSFQVLQMANVAKSGDIDWSSLSRVNIDSVKSIQMIQRGDILFKAKGFSHTAILVDRTEKNTIASSFFFIVRVNSMNVLPEYVTWYINQKPAQQYLARTSAGTGIRYVNRANLRGLEIVVPDLVTQKKVVKLHTLNQREKHLLTEIQKKRQKLIDAVMLNAIKSRKKKA